MRKLEAAAGDGGLATVSNADGLCQALVAGKSNIMIVDHFDLPACLDACVAATGVLEYAIWGNCSTAPPPASLSSPNMPLGGPKDNACALAKTDSPTGSCLINYGLTLRDGTVRYLWLSNLLVYPATPGPRFPQSVILSPPQYVNAWFVDMTFVNVSAPILLPGPKLLVLDSAFVDVIIDESIVYAPGTAIYYDQLGGSGSRSVVVAGTTFNSPRFGPSGPIYLSLYSSDNPTTTIIFANNSVQAAPSASKCGNASLCMDWSAAASPWTGVSLFSDEDAAQIVGSPSRPPQRPLSNISESDLRASVRTNASWLQALSTLGVPKAGQIADMKFTAPPAPPPLSPGLPQTPAPPQAPFLAPASGEAPTGGPAASSSTPTPVRSVGPNIRLAAGLSSAAGAILLLAVALLAVWARRRRRKLLMASKMSSAMTRDSLSRSEMLRKGSEPPLHDSLTQSLAPTGGTQSSVDARSTQRRTSQMVGAATHMRSDIQTDSLWMVVPRVEPAKLSGPHTLNVDDVPAPSGDIHSSNTSTAPVQPTPEKGGGQDAAEPQATYQRLEVIKQQVVDILNLEGGRIFDDFRLLPIHHMRSGGQGVVHFASHALDSQAVVAIKMFASERAFVTERALFKKTQLLSILPPIERMDDNADGRWLDPSGRPLPPHIIMEKGEALNEWTQRVAPDTITSIAVMCHVVRAVMDLHAAGLVHRDLKPSNTLFLPSRHQWTCMDFGCAARDGSMASLSFTLSYCAPETAAAFEAGLTTVPVSRALDVWSLGVMAFELFARTRLFSRSKKAAEVLDVLVGRAPLPWEAGGEEGGAAMERLGGMRAGVMAMLNRDPLQRPELADVYAQWTGLFA